MTVLRQSDDHHPDRHKAIKGPRPLRQQLTHIAHLLSYGAGARRRQDFSLSTQESVELLQTLSQ